MRKGDGKENKTLLLRIFRQLTPEHQADLLALVHKANEGEASNHEHLGFLGIKTGISALNQPEYSDGNNFEGSKK